MPVSSMVWWQSTCRSPSARKTKPNPRVWRKRSACGQKRNPIPVWTSTPIQLQSRGQCFSSFSGLCGTSHQAFPSPFQQKLQACGDHRGILSASSRNTQMSWKEPHRNALGKQKVIDLLRFFGTKKNKINFTASYTKISLWQAAPSLPYLDTESAWNR